MQERCQKPAGSVSLLFLSQYSEHLPHTSEVCRSIHIPAVTISNKPNIFLARNGTVRRRRFGDEM